MKPDQRRTISLHNTIDVMLMTSVVNDGETASKINTNVFWGQEPGFFENSNRLRGLAFLQNCNSRKGKKGRKSVYSCCIPVVFHIFCAYLLYTSDKDENDLLHSFSLRQLLSVI